MKKNKTASGSLKGVRVRSHVKVGEDACQECHLACDNLPNSKQVLCNFNCSHSDECEASNPAQ